MLRFPSEDILVPEQEVITFHTKDHPCLFLLVMLGFIKGITYLSALSIFESYRDMKIDLIL